MRITFCMKAENQMYIFRDFVIKNENFYIFFKKSDIMEL